MTVECPGRPRWHRRPIVRARHLVPVILCALALNSPQRVVAQESAPPLEYQVKAAFLFNFAKFVQWPSDSPRNADDGFVICVFEDDTLAQALDQAVSGKTVEGRVFRVRRLQNMDDTGSCRMLYMGGSETSRLSTLLKSIRTTAILTVGNTPGFTRQGGIINFILQDNRVRFEINPGAADRAGLRISSKLLQLATIVRDAAKLEPER
jgi:YfiR/HmsC-like